MSDAAITPQNALNRCSECGALTDAPSELCPKCSTAVSAQLPKDPSVPVRDTAPPVVPISRKRRFLARLHENERSIRHWSHTAVNLTQIIALFVVGVWTMHRFKQAEEPALKPHVRTAIDLQWTKLSKVSSYCTAKLTFKLENTGTQVVDVIEMHVRGWLSDLPNNDRSRYVPEEELRRGDPFFDQTFKGESKYILGPLAPGAKADSSFLFHLRTHSPKRVFWEAKFKTNQDQELGYEPSASDWDFVCDSDNGREGFLRRTSGTR